SMICSVECFVRFIKEPPCRGTAQLGILSFSMAQFQGGRPVPSPTRHRPALQSRKPKASAASDRVARCGSPVGHAAVAYVATLRALGLNIRRVAAYRAAIG
ncbi:hypothetical protein, partial [Botrimarina hoheduenensis]|uniref:hypothetical protein n=1 Tax=Botrimarina hoheduenensis TaxID=2528000 RepID=UPI001E37719F